MKQFKNNTIVVPFDFSDESTAAVETALQWAEPTTRIHIVHVVEPTPALISLDPAMPIPPSYDQDRHDLAEESLAKLYGNGKDDRIKLHCLVGDPGAEIADLAESLRANMIIMPSHGRKGLSRLLLGSVAERVLRMAQCPVLILRGTALQSKDSTDEVEHEVNR
jgi:nucleotide-binding universal stress UspA family protein